MTSSTIWYYYHTCKWHRHSEDDSSKLEQIYWCGHSPEEPTKFRLHLNAPEDNREVEINLFNWNQRDIYSGLLLPLRRGEKMTWEYQDASGIWRTHSLDACAKLDEALQRDFPSTWISMEGKRHSVNMTKMIQTECSTKISQRLRLKPAYTRPISSFTSSMSSPTYCSSLKKRSATPVGSSAQSHKIQAMPGKCQVEDTSMKATSVDQDGPQKRDVALSRLRSPEGQRRPTQWQWKDDDQWKDYKLEDSDTLEKEYQRKRVSQEVTLHISLPGTASILHIRVDLKEMCQRSSLSGLKRKVRRLARSREPVIQPKTEARWQWHGGSSGWKDYPGKLCEQLEQALTHQKEHCAIQMGLNDYIVNLVTMKQINKFTRKERDVQRLPIVPSPSQSSKQKDEEEDVVMRDINDSEISSATDCLQIPSQYLTLLRRMIHPLVARMEEPQTKTGVSLPFSDIHHSARTTEIAWTVQTFAENYYERLARYETCFDVEGHPEIIMAALSIALYRHGRKVQNAVRLPILQAFGNQGNLLVQVWKEWCDLARAPCDLLYNPHPLGAQGDLFGWVREGNSQFDRLQRLACSCSTLRYCLQATDIENFPEPSLLRWIKLGHLCSNAGTHQITLSYSDQSVMDAAFERATHRVSVVNAASAYHVGGGFLTGGRHALEEAMCTQSTLFLSLTDASVSAKFDNLRDHEGRPIHIPEDGIVLSPMIKVFRKGTDKGYRPLGVVGGFTLASVISVAMPNKNLSARVCPRDFSFGCEYESKVRKKFEMILLGALHSSAQILVIPDVGCGLFQNNPDQVGRVLGKVLAKKFPYPLEVMLTGLKEFHTATYESFQNCVAGSADKGADKHGSTCPSTDTC